MKYWILISIILILSGCVSQVFETETPSQLTTTPLKTLNSGEFVTPTTQTPSPKTSFIVENLDPSDRFVSEKYPDFLSDANLVMLIDDNLALYDIKTGDTKTYEQITIDSNLLFTSPDGKYISYISTKGDSKTLWLFAPSTEQTPHPFPVSSETYLLRWIDNDKIALWNYPDPNGCQLYGGFFDLKTGEVTQPIYRISAPDRTQCRFFPSISSDGMKAFFPWQIQDLRTGIAKEISLIDTVTTNPPQYLLGWTSDSISIISFNENKLFYTLDFLASTLNNQPINLQTIELPAFATKSFYWNPPVTGSNLKHLGWDLIDKNTDVSGYYVDPTKGNLPTSFYLMSMETLEAKNYHLDRSVPSKREMISFAKPVQQGYFSPDGKYLAWTIYSTADYTPPIETQVLDLETGVVVVIKDAEVFGWLIP